MRFIVPAVLLLVALLHAVPLIGVAGPARLATLYGVAVDDPDQEILLRHRAVLFGLLAAFLAWCAFQPALHRAGLAAALASVATFLVIAWTVGGYNAAIGAVVRADIAALALLAVGCVAHACEGIGGKG